MREKRDEFMKVSKWKLSKIGTMECFKNAFDSEKLTNFPLFHSTNVLLTNTVKYNGNLQKHVVKILASLSYLGQTKPFFILTL